MYIILALGLRGLFSSCTFMEHHAHRLGCAHTTLETTAVDSRMCHKTLPSQQQVVIKHRDYLFSFSTSVSSKLQLSDLFLLLRCPCTGSLKYMEVSSASLQVSKTSANNVRKIEQHEKLTDKGLLYWNHLSNFTALLK
jgi:hypothetical protein